MNQLFTVSSINPRSICHPNKSVYLRLRAVSLYVVASLSALSFMLCCPPSVIGQEKQREPMEMSVVVVNPSNTKTQTVPIKMYLPKEVTPDTVLDLGGLDIEFDSTKSMYYIYRDVVELKPGETKTFNVEIVDVWVVPQGRLDSLRDQTGSVILRLKGTEFYDSAKSLGEMIYKALETVAVTQNDDAVSRKSHIGIYRNNLKIVDQIKEDIERLEKQVTIARALPKPDVLEQSDIKTESPTKSTSWMIIFIIMLFIGMLAGVFFFTWHVQAHATKNLIADARSSAFPEQGKADEESQGESQGE